MNLSQFQAATSEDVTVVKFFSKTCMPCNAVAPFVQDMVDGFDVNFVNLDVVQAAVVASELGVMSVPQVLVYNQGELVKTLVGEQNIRNELEATLATIA